MTQMRLDYDISRGYKNLQSQKAHTSIAPRKASLRQRVMAEIEKSGITGVTLYELRDLLGVDVHCISPRLTELKTDEFIFDSGRVRQNKKGEDCTVYVAALLLSKTLEPKETKVKVVVAPFSGNLSAGSIESAAQAEKLRR